MQYVGIQTQIWRNNIKSIILLLMFPVIILATVWVFLAAVNYIGGGVYDQYGNVVHHSHSKLLLLVVSPMGCGRCCHLVPDSLFCKRQNHRRLSRRTPSDKEGEPASI